MRKCPWRVSHLHGGDSAQRRAVVCESKKMCNLMWSSGGKHLGFSWWDTPALTPDSDLGKHRRGVKIIISLPLITRNWRGCSGFTINMSEQGRCSPELNPSGYVKEYKAAAFKCKDFLMASYLHLFLHVYSTATKSSRKNYLKCQRCMNLQLISGHVQIRSNTYCNI